MPQPTEPQAETTTFQVMPLQIFTSVVEPLPPDTPPRPRPGRVLDRSDPVTTDSTGETPADKHDRTDKAE
jgi:hypothetical protein